MTYASKIVCFLRVWFSSKLAKMNLNGPISRKSLVKSRNQLIFENFWSRSLQPLLTKLAKSHILINFRKSVCIRGGGGGGGYTYFKTAQVLSSICFPEKGSILSKFMNDIHEVLFKFFFLYFLSLLKNY